MNIHGHKLKIKDINLELRKVEEALREQGLDWEEKGKLIRERNNLYRKKNAHLNTIKSLKKERSLKHGRKQ